MSPISSVINNQFINTRLYIKTVNNPIKSLTDSDKIPLLQAKNKKSDSPLSISSICSAVQRVKCTEIGDAEKYSIQTKNTFTLNH